MISLLDSKVLDANSEHLGVSVDTLMDNAGQALADVVLDTSDGKRILFVCGNGNNGGDGFSAVNAILDRSVTVAIFSEPKTPAAKKQYAKLSKKAVRFKEVDLKNYDVIVDCALGTGIKGDLKEPYISYIDAVNESKKIVIACDIPSGFGTKSQIIPDITITFHDLKEGMTSENCGSIIIADIGIPDDAMNLVGPGDMLRYPIPDKNGHKGQNGKLLIIGGGPYVGAPAMSAMAALRIGVDLVRIATPEPCFIPIASMSPSFIMHQLPGKILSKEDIPELLTLSDEVDAVLIGPGLGMNDDTKDAVNDFVKMCKKPMVIDADGINAIGNTKIKFKAPVVFTPHHMEMKKLLEYDSDENAVVDFALNNKAVVVLKGAVDMITDGKRIRKNTSGTPAMTVGGTGDALAGIIAGLLAKGVDPFNSGCMGAYICGKAGEKAFDEFSYGMTAPDLIYDIAKVLKDHIG